MTNDETVVLINHHALAEVEATPGRKRWWCNNWKWCMLVVGVVVAAALVVARLVAPSMVHPALFLIFSPLISGPAIFLLNEHCYSKDCFPPHRPCWRNLNF